MIRPHGATQLDELGRILLSPALGKRRIGIYGYTDAAGWRRNRPKSFSTR